jgi:hypothetical protein
LPFIYRPYIVGGFRGIDEAFGTESLYNFLFVSIPFV